jgi:hypothetical protein
MNVEATRRTRRSPIRLSLVVNYPGAERTLRRRNVPTNPNRLAVVADAMTGDDTAAAVAVARNVMRMAAATAGDVFDARRRSGVQRGRNDGSRLSGGERSGKAGTEKEHGQDTHD